MNSFTDRVVLKNREERVRGIIETHLKKWKEEFSTDGPPALYNAVLAEVKRREEKALVETLRHLDVADLFVAVRLLDGK